MNQNDPMDESERTLALHNMSHYPTMEAGLAKTHFWSNRHWRLVTHLHIRYGQQLLFITIWEDLFHPNWWLGYNLVFVTDDSNSSHSPGLSHGKPDTGSLQRACLAHLTIPSFAGAGGCTRLVARGSCKLPRSSGQHSVLKWWGRWPQSWWVIRNWAHFTEIRLVSAACK